MPSPPDTALTWLQFASDDLHAARLLLTTAELPGRLACFHAQQAAEKAIKALLVRHQIPFRKTHDLAVLVAPFAPGIRAQLEAFDLQLLQQWAVDARYPADLPEIDTSAAATVVDLAQQVLDTISSTLNGRS